MVDRVLQYSEKYKIATAIIALVCFCMALRALFTAETPGLRLLSLYGAPLPTINIQYFFDQFQLIKPALAWFIPAIILLAPIWLLLFFSIQSGRDTLTENNNVSVMPKKEKPSECSGCGARARRVNNTCLYCGF